RYQHQPLVEQSLQQIAHQHGIADVGNVKFIEAQQAMLPRDIAGDLHKRIFVALQIAQPVMDVLHETVKMDAALARDRNEVEKRIHEEALAPAHASPEVQTADRAFA